MAKSKAVKTNVMRILEREGVSYVPHEYDPSDGAIDGESVAHKLGVPRERVFKTLVTEADGLYVFVIPVHAHLDLKKAARAAGMKKLEMLPQKRLKPETGYVHGGCSPVGRSAGRCSPGAVGECGDLIAYFMRPIYMNDAYIIRKQSQ